MAPQLELVQNMDYKQLQLLMLDCTPTDDNSMRTNITYRFGCMRARHDYLKNKLRDITSIIKLKNPTLLL